MIEYERKALQGVPDYRAAELLPKRSEYCLLIPVINEGARILTELGRAQTAGVDTLCDIVICDGGSTDGSMKLDTLQLYGVNTLLTKTGPGKQGAQLRMGIYFALNRGYKGVLTIDGNNKDSIEDVHKFIEKLQAGYDFVQGSRFIRGGHAVNTPPVRYAAVRLVHAPLISLGAHRWFTDTTNAYRAYSREYLTHPEVRQPRVPDPPRGAPPAGRVYGVRAAGVSEHPRHAVGHEGLRGPRDPRLPRHRQDPHQDQRL